MFQIPLVLVSGSCTSLIHISLVSSFCIILKSVPDPTDFYLLEHPEGCSRSNWFIASGSFRNLSQIPQIFSFWNTKKYVPDPSGFIAFRSYRNPCQIPWISTVVSKCSRRVSRSLSLSTVSSLSILHPPSPKTVVLCPVFFLLQGCHHHRHGHPEY
jgi:hypothetical protein